MKFRKANTVGHPHAKLDIDEEAFTSIYCNLFFEKPTPEEYFFRKPITYTCEDHRLKLADDERMEEPSQRPKDDFDQKKQVLADQVRLSDKDDMRYDDLITDITELTFHIC